ncbi:MAG: hypothetical protein LKE46_09615 [Clostridium sp.]|jgi:hypothetical protein|uniref:hypothetical protein n=1 Tax=Clostridium sp. TaxID=1506 RepID=UPI0025C14309|nr:hypothetical protein [Clostridium sp.]MCH3964521.1 hypothetical protein [Clostridium sp.]MCI1714992.1 hypothetical protein [Clostridium sp.]MCI1799254.1 hypothetical protein [Clostridium sp.]MCI1813175.1 hypothetical protein [Clostridium sp.]MCI1870066.1 hypothetical protein [Clostridium sp.]
MTDVMSDNLQNEIFNELNCAQKSVKIAVAWINFEVYKKLFKQLLTNGINLKIVINDDFINSRYDSIIEDLKLYGAKIKKFRMASNRQYMHENLL